MAIFPGSSKASATIAPQKKGEAYFISHGGPPSMYDTESEPYRAWKSFGRIIAAASPKGLVVVSAHWENPSEIAGVQVNSDPTNPLIYDFYNFPKHYYQETFQSHGDAELLKDTVDALKQGGVAVEEVKRGADHGLWVPLKVAFDGKTDIPIVQVSLPGDSSPQSTVKLGQALGSLRDKGYAVIGSGQVVHNLRDIFGGAPTPYSKPFLDDVVSAVQSPKAIDASTNLFRHPLYKRAHPTPEHLLPLLVPIAAADAQDEVHDIYVGLDKMGMGWGMWRWAPKEGATA